MVNIRELTKEEKLQKAKRRAKLLEKFPNGIARIEAIWDKKEPYVENPTIDDYKKPRATSTPAMPVYVTSGGTNPNSGLAEYKSKKIDISIWPLDGRTDQAGELNRYYKPIEILEWLADPSMGWTTIYKLKPVSQAELEAERDSIRVPESKAELDRLAANKMLQRNPSDENSLRNRGESNRPLSGRVIKLDEMAIDGIDDGLNEAIEDESTGYDQLSDTERMEMGETAPVEDEEQTHLMNVVSGNI